MYNVSTTNSFLLYYGNPPPHKKIFLADTITGQWHPVYLPDTEKILNIVRTLLVAESVSISSSKTETDCSKSWFSAFNKTGIISLLWYAGKKYYSF